MGQGSNSRSLRQYNERAVLNALRRVGQASKADLARQTSLTPQGVTRITDELERLGLIRPEGLRRGGKGQPSTLYGIDPEGAYTVGIQLGRTDLELVLTDFDSRVLNTYRESYAFPDPDHLLSAVSSAVRHLLEMLDGKQATRFAGIGIATPFFIGQWQGETGIPERESARWRELDLLAEVRSLTGKPVYVENDCTAAALAELTLGLGGEHANFLYLYIDTILGGGLVLDGDIAPGVHGNGAAVFSMPVPQRPADGRGSEETYEPLMNRASLFVLLQRLRDAGFDVDHPDALSGVTGAARDEIQRWLEDAADAISFALLSAIGLLDLDAVVLQGRLPTHLLQELLLLVDRSLQARQPEGVFVPALVLGELDAGVVARGGALLPIRARFAPDSTILLRGGVPDRQLGG